MGMRADIKHLQLTINGNNQSATKNTIIIKNTYNMNFVTKLKLKVKQ